MESHKTARPIIRLKAPAELPVDEIIVTLNDSRVSKAQCRRFADLGASMFRLNGTFVKTDTIARTMECIRDAVGSRVRVILDLPGYKIRLLYLPATVKFGAGARVELRARYLNYPEIVDLVAIGSLIRINDGRITLKVVKKKRDGLVCIANRAGVLSPGKGLHPSDVSFRPSTFALSDRDRGLIAVAILHDIDCVGLSFANNAADVLHVQQQCRGSRIEVIPKIESKDSVKSVAEIVAVANEVIIDRGDLAGEIGLERIWATQREVIAACRAAGVKVHVATQVLASMVRNPLPSIAEVDSLYSLLSEGIAGVQLSEETSVGRYAADAIAVVDWAFKDRLRLRGAAWTPASHADLGMRSVGAV